MFTTAMLRKGLEGRVRRLVGKLTRCPRPEPVWVQIFSNNSEEVSEALATAARKGCDFRDQERNHAQLAGLVVVPNAILVFNADDQLICRFNNTGRQQNPAAARELIRQISGTVISLEEITYEPYAPDCPYMWVRNVRGSWNMEV